MSYPERYRGPGGLSMQHSDELRDFLKFAVDHDVHNYLEIGLAHGVTFHAVGVGLGPGLSVGVDLADPSQWAQDQAYRDPAPPMLAWNAIDMSRDGRVACVIWGNSHTPEVIAAVRRLGPFDLVLIDGDHSYAGVNQDWHDYGPMGKFTAFHDILTDFGDPDGGPRRLWQELKAKQPEGIEFTSGGMGIGVVW